MRSLGGGCSGALCGGETLVGKGGGENWVWDGYVEVKEVEAF